MHRFAYCLLRKRVMHQYYWLLHTSELEILGTAKMDATVKIYKKKVKKKGKIKEKKGIRLPNF